MTHALLQKGLPFYCERREGIHPGMCKLQLLLQAANIWEMLIYRIMIEAITVLGLCRANNNGCHICSMSDDGKTPGYTEGTAQKRVMGFIELEIGHDIVSLQVV